MSDRAYGAAGIDYSVIDPAKILAQGLAARTAAHLAASGAAELAGSRGESAYVVRHGDLGLALVTEALGTKNLVADAVRAQTGRTHYDAIARDTVATIVNDLCSVGARPLCITSYWAAGDGSWFSDVERARDLSEGWAAACDECRISWGGGETQVLPALVESGRIVLGGSALGLVEPIANVLSGDRIEIGDRILIAPASGIHANGLTLARKLASDLPQGYRTPIGPEPGARSYGEALLDPSPQYAPLFEALRATGVPLHYAAHVTGHGWRKLMRADRDLGYVVREVPAVPPVLAFMRERLRMEAEEAYGTLNMGAGFALFVPPVAVAGAQRAATTSGFELLDAGEVVGGPRRVVIEPIAVTFEGTALQIRTEADQSRK